MVDTCPQVLSSAREAQERSPFAVHRWTAVNWPRVEKNYKAALAGDVDTIIMTG